MLIDPEFILPDRDLAIIARAMGEPNNQACGSKVDQGIWWSTFPFNFRHTIRVPKGLEYDFPSWDDGEFRSSYGVADTTQQIVAWAQFLRPLPEHYCIGLTLVRRDDQPEDGGWRWHKWGPYIGEKNPRHEYLYDEKDIDEVICYSVVRIL